MNTNQLKAALTLMGLEGDVLPYDLFQNSMLRDDREQAFILNTGDSSTDGEHWVCLLNNPGSVEFFDSYGLHPTVCFPNLQFKKPLICNEMWIQDVASNVCGHHCLYFLHKRRHQIGKMEDLKYLYSENCHSSNDKLAHEFVKSHYCIAFKHKTGKQCCIPCQDILNPFFKCTPRF